MSRRPETFLYDALHAVNAVREFTAGKRYADYQRSALLRSAVERQLEIVGEALSRLRALDTDKFGAIRGGRQAIGLRNVLIHGYASVEDAIVWDTLERDLPGMREDLESQLAHHGDV